MTASRILLASCLLLATPALLHAQPQDVAELISILQKRPSDMNEDMWREKRREAARTLGRLGDKKAVRPLIKVVESERFDAIAEISIDSLGRLGDNSAISVLRKVYDDPSRDRYARDAAETALRRLGANPEGGSLPKDGGRGSGSASGSGSGSGDSGFRGGRANQGTTKPGEFPLPEDDEDLKAPAGPGLPGDVIAAHENWTLAVGSLDLTFDTESDAPQVWGNVTSHYQTGREQTAFGYSVDGALGLDAAVRDEELGLGNNSSILFNIAASVTSEARLYFGNSKGFFLHGDGGSLLGFRSIKVKDAVNPISDLDALFNLTLGLGPGYGRVLNVGEAMRLRRIQQVLKSHGMLGRAINASVAKRMFAAWWGLRDELGTRRRLLATLQILRERGVLLTAPDASVMYKILKILEDGQLAQRPEGMDVRVGVGETFALVERDPAADDHEFQRRETAFLRATYAQQLHSGATEFIATGRTLYGITGDPGFYTADAEIIYRRYFYGAAWDAKGALEFGAHVGVSDLDTTDMIKAGTLLGGHIAYLFVPSRASRMRLETDFRLQGSTMFLDISFGANFGSLDAAVAPW